MRFSKGQRATLVRTWNVDSWFYQYSSEPVRHIIEHAYGLRACDAKTRTKCQEDVSLALSLFATKVGCGKDQACHALLSGSILHLLKALEKVYAETQPDGLSPSTILDAWVDSFRESNMGVGVGSDTGRRRS